MPFNKEKESDQINKCLIVKERQQKKNMFGGEKKHVLDFFFQPLITVLK